MRQAQCPSCGGPIEWKLGSSAALVCPWCRFSVVRTDRDLRAIGRIADLVPTAPIMAVGDYGTIDGEEFVVGGRLQLDHGAGPWDEWYVELPRQRRWGWLAKAQGRFYLTMPVETSGLPAFDHMTPGTAGRLPGAGDVDWTVAERGGSALLSAEGELPYPAIPGESGRYVDLHAPGGGFATIDYGDGSEPPKLYVGREIAHDRVQFREGSVGARPVEKVDVARLRCPTCGGPVPILVPEETERAACPSCSSLLDFEQGELRLLGQLNQGRVQPLVPLGQKGTLRGVEHLCIGLMERATIVDGVEYRWREYLLHTPQGYRWLLEDNNHFTYVTTINAADVTPTTTGADYQGRSYRLFSSVQTVVRFVVGEFYWKVQLGETAHASDYIAPPFILSEERSANEAIWSQGEYVTGKEIWRAFGLPGSPPAPIEVAPAQPNPVRIGLPMAFAALGLVALAVVWFATRPAQTQPIVLVDGEVAMPPVPDPDMVTRGGQTGVAGIDFDPLAGTPFARPTTTPPSGAYTAPSFTPPFFVPETADGIEVIVQCDMGSGWLGVAAALIHQPSGMLHEVVLEHDDFHGLGASRSFMRQVVSAKIGRLAPGRYLLRLDPRWARKRGSTGEYDVPAVRVALRTVHERGAGDGCLFLTALLLFAPVPLAFMRRSAFEGRRWYNSNLTS